MSELTDLQVAEQKIEFYKEQLRHERRMRENADKIIRMLEGKVRKMVGKIERMGELLERVKAERDAAGGAK